MSEISEKRNSLGETVARMRPRIEARTRPFVVEFSGTPKSGKTTTTSSVDLFLRRHHFKTRLIGESGSVAPISDKVGFTFNLWTATTTLTWLLEGLEAKPQFILIDRGLFDSQIWSTWHQMQHNITSDTKKSVDGFFLMETVRSLIDIVFLMTSSPEVAIERERQHMLTDRPGRIMNIDTLKQLLN